MAVELSVPGPASDVLGGVSYSQHYLLHTMPMTTIVVALAMTSALNTSLDKSSFLLGYQFSQKQNEELTAKEVQTQIHNPRLMRNLKALPPDIY